MTFSGKPKMTPNEKIGLLLGGNAETLKIDTQLFGRSNNNNDNSEVGDMAKTSMFGGHINSAELPTSPAGSRLQYKSPNNNENADPSAALSCYSVKGSSVYRSPSPSNKDTDQQQLTSIQDKFSANGMSFLERMAHQGTAAGV